MSLHGSAAAPYSLSHAGIYAIPGGPHDVHQCLLAVLKQFSGPIRQKRLHVSLQFLARDYRLTRSPEHLLEVFASLVRSAIGAAPAGGRITLRSTCPSDGVLRVDVAEHGVRRTRDAAARTDQTRFIN